MGLVTISGQAGCRLEEVARISARRLQFQLVTSSRLDSLIKADFGQETVIPDRAWTDATASILARDAMQHHLLFCGESAESLARYFPGSIRVCVTAPESVRAGHVMLERRLERPAARALLREMERREKARRKERFGRAQVSLSDFDLVLSGEKLEPEQMAEVIAAAVDSSGFRDRGYLSSAAEAQLQFQVRLRLSKCGLAVPSSVGLRRNSFGHPSEQIFANLLEFYRITWEYEPRSFPIQWDRDGKMSEAFTPDFYLPEFDLYVELTTMKQSLVTKKNRKVKLLRAIYPHINIQVFYQKDFENLVFKYGLVERFTTA